MFYSSCFLPFVSSFLTVNREFFVGCAVVYILFSEFFFQVEFNPAKAGRQRSHSSHFQNQTRHLTITNTNDEGFWFSFHKTKKFWYVCASTCPSAVCTTWQAMWNITLFRYSVGPIIVHPCCGQLTAVKTGYVLTSITWPYFWGSRVSGAIEDTYFFEVICWQVSSFQLIAGSTPSRFLCDSHKFIVWSKYKLGALLLASAKSIVC